MSELTDFLLTECRHIRLEDYRAQADIGVLPKEKGHPQELLITLDVWVKDNRPTVDSIDAVYDYRALPKAIEETLSAGHIDLQETVAERIAEKLLKDTTVYALRVATRKTEAVANAKSIGIEIFRKR